jgi:hypothetical protein
LHGSSYEAVPGRPNQQLWVNYLDKYKSNNQDAGRPTSLVQARIDNSAAEFPPLGAAKSHQKSKDACHSVNTEPLVYHNIYHSPRDSQNRSREKSHTKSNLAGYSPSHVGHTQGQSMSQGVNPDDQSSQYTAGTLYNGNCVEYVPHEHVESVSDSQAIPPKVVHYPAYPVIDNQVQHHQAHHSYHSNYGSHYQIDNNAHGNTSQHYPHGFSANWAGPGAKSNQAASNHTNSHYQPASNDARAYLAHRNGSPPGIARKQPQPRQNSHHSLHDEPVHLESAMQFEQLAAMIDTNTADYMAADQSQWNRVPRPPSLAYSSPFDGTIYDNIWK